MRHPLTLGTIRSALLNSKLPDNTPILRPGSDHSFSPCSISVGELVVAYDEGGYGESSGDDEFDREDGEPIKAIIIR